MSTSTIIRVRCDWPQSNRCDQWYETHAAGVAAARMEAAQQGSWLRVGKLDFCPDLHAPMLRRKHAPRVTERAGIDRYDLRRVHPRCSCGWATTVDTVHPSLLVGMSELTFKQRALDVWFQAHIRVDVAGTDPLWTRQAVEETQADLRKNFERLGLKGV